MTGQDWLVAAIAALGMLGYALNYITAMKVRRECRYREGDTRLYLYTWVFIPFQALAILIAIWIYPVIIRIL